MDCRGDELIQHNNRTSAQAVPFQYLINEQAKSILALQELQNEVGALLEFRDMVMDSFPHLRHKQVSCSPEPSSGSQGVGSGENRWEPGVRVRRKLASSSGWIAGSGGGNGLAPTGPRSRSNSHGNKGPKSGEPTTTSVGTVQDSGFCTESKDSSSTSSRTTTTKTGCCKDEDELWSLLEVIQDKGTKLKLEVQFLQSRLLRDDGKAQQWRYSRQRWRRHRSLEDLAQKLVQCDDRGNKRLLSPAAHPDDYCTDYNVFRARVTDLKRERDMLMDRVIEMEAESLSNAAQIHRLLAELRSVVCENKELEDRLRGGISDKSSSRSTVCATSITGKSSSHNNNKIGGDTGGFTPVQLESSTGPSSSSAGRDAYYTPNQHSVCNLSSIELCNKRCLSLSSSYAETDDAAADHPHRSELLLVRPSDPISRNLEGRASSPTAPATTPAPASTNVLLGSPTFDKLLGVLDGIVSSPGERIGKPSTPDGHRGTPLPKRTLAAILKTFNPIELQRHLITVSYENKNLLRQMEMLNKSKSDVAVELNKSKEDNEELKFQLEEKRIELEGTMARVRLLQLHQEQHQHGLVTASPHQQQHHQSAANNQWLDLVPSNPILPQIALPGTPASSATANRNGHLMQDENGGGSGGGSSTESAHHARSGSGVRQPSKIPVVKTAHSAVVKSAPSYRGGEHYHHQQQQSYQSWNKADQSSLPRYWEPINPINPVNGKSGSNGSSIGSGAGGKHYHHLQQQHHRSRKDSAGNGGTSLTRARSQNHHQQQRNGNVAAVKDGCRTAGGGTVATAAFSHSHPMAVADDTNKPVKKLFRRRNLVRQSRCLIDNKKTVLPAVDEVQEPPESMVAAAARAFRLQDDDDIANDDEEFFFDSIESSLATSAASSRRLPPECDSIDLSQPDASLPTA